MTDDVQKNQGQNPGQSGQPQQKDPQDASKKNPTQIRIRSTTRISRSRIKAASVGLPRPLIGSQR